MFGCILQQRFCAKSILVLLYFNFVNNPGLFWIGVLSYNYPNKMLIISVTPSSIETNDIKIFPVSCLKVIKMKPGS